MNQVNLKDLLEAGCHFGHEIKRWHPKAKKFIYLARNNIHIIDLVKTRQQLLKAGDFVRNLGKKGKKILFVGTKKQAREIVENEAKRVGAAYFVQRWIGGFITNWSEIKKNIDKLRQMEEDKKSGAWQKFVKHEQLLLERERLLLEKFYGGVKSLKELPSALFVVDIKKESTAVNEARRRSIPVIGIVDTNSDPTKVSYPIPANDDAIKSITLITKYIASCYEEGLLASQKSEKAETQKQAPPKEKTTAKTVPKTKTKKAKPKIIKSKPDNQKSKDKGKTL